MAFSHPLLFAALAPESSASAEHRVESHRNVRYRVADGQSLRLDAYLPTDGVNPGVVVLFEAGWVSGCTAMIGEASTTANPWLGSSAESAVA